MLELSLETTVYLLLSIHCTLGIIAAIIAYIKGRNFGLWLILGLICGTAALIVSLIMKKNK
jgi:ABC-type transport system involved in multi-copper enzyme maturation permease subunit